MTTKNNINTIIEQATQSLFDEIDILNDTIEKLTQENQEFEANAVTTGFIISDKLDTIEKLTIERDAHKESSNNAALKIQEQVDKIKSSQQIITDLQLISEKVQNDYDVLEQDYETLSTQLKENTDTITELELKVVLTTDLFEKAKEKIELLVDVIVKARDVLNKV